MSTTDWRQSTWGKIISMILTFALSFSFIPLSAYADEAEDATDAVASVEATADTSAPAPDAQPADEGSEDAVPDPEPAGSIHPVAQPTAAEEAAAIDDEPNSQLTEDLTLEFVGYAYVGNVIVKVTAPAGVLEIGTQVKATAVTDEAVIDAVDDVMASQKKEMADSIAIDVELVNAEGNVVQPNGTVNVSFFDANVEGADVAVYHVSDDANQVQKVPTLQADSEVQSFNVNHFSIYVVAGIATPRFVTYRFFVPSEDDLFSSEPSYTQRVQKGDALNPIPTPEYPGTVLAGWSTLNPNESSVSRANLLSSAELFTVVNALPEAQNDTIDYYAVYLQAVNVSFASKAEQEASIIYTATGYRGDAVDTSYAASLIAVGENEGVAGWSNEPGGANKAAAGTYALDSDTDVTLYPIIATGTWVEFDLGTTDITATYIEPRFVPAGKSYGEVYGSDNLPQPARTGYNFSGWTVEDSSPDVVLNKVQDSNAVLTASWDAGQTSVEVVAYIEKKTTATEASNDKDDYERLIPSSPSVYTTANMFSSGTIINVEDNASTLLDGYDYEAQNYTVNTQLTTKEAYVEGDGSTQIDIYLSRARKTVELYTGSTESTGGQKIFGAPAAKSISYVYGEDISAKLAAFVTDSLNGMNYKWFIPDVQNGSYVVNAASAIADLNNVDGYDATIPDTHTLVFCGLPLQTDEVTGTLFYYKWNPTTSLYDFDHSASIYKGVALSTFQGPGNLELKQVAYVGAEDYTNATTEDGANIQTLISQWDWCNSGIENDPIAHIGNVYVLYEASNEGVSQDAEHSVYFTIKGGNGADWSRDISLPAGASVGSALNALGIPEVPAGYSFKAWYLDPTYSADHTSYTLSEMVVPGHTLALFGFFVPQTPVVSFATNYVDANTSSASTTSTVPDIKYGERINAAQLPTVKVGDDVVSTGTSAYAPIAIPDDCTWYGWCIAGEGGFTKFNFSMPIEKDITLVPYCTTSDTYQVEYLVDGQVVKTDPATYEALATAPVLPYDGDQADFVCWNVTKNSKTYNFYAGDTTAQVGTIQQDGKVKMEAAFQTQLPQVGIVYHSQGQKNTFFTDSVDNNGVIEIDGYMFGSTSTRFLGWATEPDASVVEFETGQSVVVTQENAKVVETAEGRLVVAYNELYPVFGYTVKYDLDGGEFFKTDEFGNEVPGEAEFTSYVKIDNSITLQTPRRTGYDFNGWTGANGDEPRTEVIVEPGTTGNLEYKANWTKKGGFYFDIRYVYYDDATFVSKDILVISNDAFGEFEFEDVVFLEDYDSYTEDVTLPGYTTTLLSPEITIYDGGVMADGKRFGGSFIFQCTPIPYMIDYLYNGGNQPMVEVIIDEGGADPGTMDPETGDMPGTATGPMTELRPANPTSYSIESAFTVANPDRPGFDFKGWRVSQAVAASSDDGSASQSYAPVTWSYDPYNVTIDPQNIEGQSLANLQLEALWEEDGDVTLTYEAKGSGTVKLLTGGDAGASFTQTLKPVTETPAGAMAVANGSKFVGWYLGDTLVTESAELTPELIDQFGRTDGVLGNLTYTAVFEEFGNTYDVVYRVQSIDGVPTGSVCLTESESDPSYGSQQVDSGININGTDGINSYTAYPAPAFMGGFDGWYVGDDKVSENTTLATDVIKAHLNMRENDTLYTDTTFEARFLESAPFKMYFEGSEGGTVSNSVLEVRPFYGVNGTNSFEVQAIAEPGYVFDGWLDADGEQISWSSDLTIYATDSNEARDHGIFNSRLFTSEGSPYKAIFRPNVGEYFGLMFKTADASQGGVALGEQGSDADYLQFVSARAYRYEGEEGITGATAQAKPGYVFAGWVDAEGNTVCDIPYIDPATIQSLRKADEAGTDLDLTFTATFKMGPDVAITYLTDNADEGMLQMGDEIHSSFTESLAPMGTVPTEVTAVAMPGYKVKGWYDADGKLVSDEGQESFRPERPAGTGSPYENATYTVEFTVDYAQTYTITYTAAVYVEAESAYNPGHGTVSILGEPNYAPNRYESGIQVLSTDLVKGAEAQADGGYKFAGWYVYTGEAADTRELITTDALLSKDMVVNYLKKQSAAAYADTTFYAQFDEDFESAADYTISFLDVDRNEVQGTETGMATVGKEKTFEAPEVIGGYKIVGSSTQTVMIDDKDRTYAIEFLYEPRTDMSYTVKCVDNESQPLSFSIDEKESNENGEVTIGEQTYLSNAEVFAPEIPGYQTPKKQDIVVGIDQVVMFTYLPRNDLSYTVKCVEFVEENGETVASEIQSDTFGDMTFKQPVTVEAPDITGFDKVAPTVKAITIEAEDNEVIFQYQRIEGLSYTVNYYEMVDGVKTQHEVADPKNVSGLTFGDEFVEEAIDIDGYYKVNDQDNPDSQTIEIGVDGNVVDFYYTIRTDMTYTVKCTDEHDAPLSFSIDEQKSNEKGELTIGDRTYMSKVEVSAPDVTGYTTENGIQTIIIGKDPQGAFIDGNTVTFKYAKRTNLSYTVKYVEKDDTTQLLQPSKTVAGQTYLDEVTVEPVKDIPGYITPDAKTITIHTDGNIVTFEYAKRTDLSYTVNYLERTGEDQTTVLAAPKEEKNNQTYKSYFHENAPAIPGYDVDGAPEQAVTIGVAEGGAFTENTVINFYYTKKNTLSYTVKYLEQGTENEVAPEKVVGDQTYKASVTESAIEVNGYNQVDPTEATIAIDVTDNIITFYYTKKTNLSYTVNYLVESINASGEMVTTTLKTSTTRGQTFGDKIEVTAAEIDGYTKPAEDSLEITIGKGMDGNYTTNTIVDFYYAKRTDLSYTVNYFAKGTDRNGEPIITPVFTSETVYNQTFLDRVVVRAKPILPINGYNMPDPAEQTITITTGTNVVDFYYQPVNDLSYTVYYIEQGSHVELAQPKLVENQVYSTWVTEEPIDITGYTKPAGTQSLLIEARDDNAIYFQYTKSNTLSYTVNYYKAGTAATVAEQKVVGDCTYQETYTEAALSVEGYTVDAESKDITITATGDSIDFYYTPVTDRSYIIKCVDADGSIAEDKTIDGQTFGETVTVKAPEVDGYVAPEAQTITIEYEGNEVTFVYTPRTDMAYTVYYRDAQGNDVADPTTGTAAFKEIVTVSAVSIPEYFVDQRSKDVQIGFNNGKFAENTEIYFIYSPRTDCMYRVQYRMPDGTTKLESFGNQTYGATVEVKPEALDGYNAVPASKAITIDMTPQIVNFQYEKRTDLAYSVNYLEVDTNDVLRDRKVATGTFQDKVTYGAEIKGINIEGYQFAYAEPESFSIGTDARSNVMNLYYTLRSDLSVTINHLSAETNAPLATPSIMAGLKYGTKIELGADQQLAIEGYAFDRFSTDSITIGTESITVNAYYKPRTDISYTIRYLIAGSDVSIRDDQTVTAQTFGKDVTVTAPTIADYVLVSASTQTAKLGIDNNVFTFEYKKATGLTYTVQYVYRGAVVESKMVAGDGDGYTHGSIVTVGAELPTGYNLATDEEATKNITIGLESDENIVTFNVTPKTGLKYFVKYLDADASESQSNVIETKEVWDKNFGEVVTEAAKDIEGYTRPAETTQTITIGLDNDENVIEFYYTRVTGLSYTVLYVNQDTDVELGSKTVENKSFNEVVTENAQEFQGYTPVEATKDVTVGLDTPDVIFYYAPDTDIKYQVRYLLERGETTLSFGLDKFLSGTMATVVTEEALDIPGYTVKGDKTQSITLNHTGNVITFTYTANTDITYTVQGVRYGTTEVLYAETVENQTMGVEVTVAAPDLVSQGYALAPTESSALGPRALAATDNVFTFQYVPRSDLTYTIQYRDAEGNQIRPDDVVEGQTFESMVTVVPEPIDRYVAPESQTITIGLENNIVSFVYEKQAITGDMSYTIRYVYASNGEEARPSTEMTGFTVGDEIPTIEAPAVLGYKADAGLLPDGSAQPLVISEDSAQNVITFTYSVDWSDLSAARYLGTYDGEGHNAWFEKGKLPTDEVYITLNGVQVAEDHFVDVEDVWVRISVIRNGEQSPSERKQVKIKPALYEVHTNDAQKTYDGTPLKASGTLTGLVANETATLVLTGEQVAPGTSKNTYEVRWAPEGGTAKATNYQEDINASTMGTLYVSEAPIEEIETPTISSGLTAEDIQPRAFTGTRQAQVTVPIQQQIADDEAPLAEGVLPGGELMPGANGISFGDLSGKATGIAVLTISGILLTALYTLFAVGRRKRFLKGRSDDLM